MEAVEIRKTLYQRAISFHSILQETEVYHKPVSKDDFVQRTAAVIDRRIQNVINGVEELELTILSLPVGLLYQLSDVVPVVTWDYEFGYNHLFEQLETLFVVSPHIFEWQYNVQERQIQFSIDDVTWNLNDINASDEVNFEDTYGILIGSLSEYLHSRGHCIFEPTTGDQAGTIMLIPVQSVDRLREYLISTDDPRSRWFYEGIS